MLNLTPSSMCITDQQTEFTVFNNQKQSVFCKLQSSNQTAYQFNKDIFELKPLSSHIFTIMIKIQRHAQESDSIVIQYGNEQTISSPKIIKINLTNSSITAQQVKNIFYQMDYEQLAKEQITLQGQLLKTKKQIFEIECQGTSLYMKRKNLEKSVASIELSLGLNIKDWKQRVIKVTKSLENIAFIAGAYLVGFILGIKW